MDESKSPYYELHKIKSYRLLAIDEAVCELKKLLGIKKVPIDCVELIKKINARKDINISIKGSWDLPPGKIALTVYVRPMDYYLVSVNNNQLYDKGRKRKKYPFKNSPDSMVNLTLAYEFGRIALDHGKIPDSLKTEELKDEEDLEAYEFAGRFLMPKRYMRSGKCP